MDVGMVAAAQLVSGQRPRNIITVICPPGKNNGWYYEC